MNDPRPEAERGAAEPQHTLEPKPNAGVRCVALLTADATEPAELTAAMARRGVEIRCVRTAYDALLGVLSDDARDAGPIALVIVDSEAHPHDQPRRLIRACSRRVPSLSVWTFDGSPPRLRPLAASRGDEAHSPPVREPDTGPRWTPGATPAPRLRLTGFHEPPAGDRLLATAEPGPVEASGTGGDRTEAAPGSDSPAGVSAGADGSLGPAEDGDQPVRASDLLTSEEIAMLLDDFPEARPVADGSRPDTERGGNQA